MSVNDLIDLSANYRAWLLGYFLALPVLTMLVAAALNSLQNTRIIDYCLSMFIYFSAIPGMFSASLIFYSLFIAGHDLLKVDAVVYFLPIISMGSIFYLIGRKTDFDHLPGFGRLSGLMILLILVWIGVLCLYRFRFVIGFFSSVQSLIVIGLILFFIFKFGAYKAFGTKAN